MDWFKQLCVCCQLIKPAGFTDHFFIGNFAKYQSIEMGTERHGRTGPEKFFQRYVGQREKRREAGVKKITGY